MSIYDSSGTLLATDDGDPRAQPYTMVNDQELNLNLAAGTYYVALESHGNYGDQGQYVVRVDPIPAAWKADDIGLPNLPGYVSYNSATSTYTVAGSGDDIWNTYDSFQFLYQTLSGNGSITARITSMTNTDYSAKSGVMIRESLDGGSRFADLVMTPSDGVYAQDRVTTNGDCGGRRFFVGYRPLLGANYAFRHAARDLWKYVHFQDIQRMARSGPRSGRPRSSMGKNVYLGLVSTSHNNSRINAATFTNVSFTGTINPSPTLNALGGSGSVDRYRQNLHERQSFVEQCERRRRLQHRTLEG